ncbi:hypothetical protein EXIGLDRAFT_372361 [Exidia glandulosa HHB12029]|uniref:Uncharacterized protein n=1 Tax=Exidia glandulosa HHB12029 TaxID=1314781 RepID=A0A165PWM4_EXIGL|nr:hypothetical protein EXIGLDRAFT_372361 [Exidia glandulosa HHB12029]
MQQRRRSGHGIPSDGQDANLFPDRSAHPGLTSAYCVSQEDRPSLVVFPSHSACLQFDQPCNGGHPPINFRSETAPKVSKQATEAAAPAAPALKADTVYTVRPSRLRDLRLQCLCSRARRRALSNAFKQGAQATGRWHRGDTFKRSVPARPESLGKHVR